MQDQNCRGLVLRTMEQLSRRNGLLTEAEAASLFNLSPTWFRHQFRNGAGISFRSARLRVKLSYGLNLLATTQLSITEISIRLQYSDRTKFEKAFKREYKETPFRYRQRQDPI